MWLCSVWGGAWASRGGAWASLACALTACSISIPEGAYTCEQDSDCPSDWVCVARACYEERPSASADAGGADASATGGQRDGGDMSNPEGGTPSGDAAAADAAMCADPGTYYRDDDGDGLGDPYAMLTACGDGPGYVANSQDCDDACTLCTTGAAAEVCDGFDNQCNGVVDEGALEVGPPIEYPGLENGQWVEVVATADGAIVFTLFTASTTVAAHIKAQRVNVNGQAVGAAVTIPDAVPGLPVLSADHLNGKVVLAYVESAGVRAVSLNAADLSVSVAEVAVSSAAAVSPLLDVAISTSAAGGRALVAYASAGKVKVQGFRLSTLGVDTPLSDIYTLPNGSDAFYVVGTLAGAPCLSGFYLALSDTAQKTLSVIPLGDDGAVSGTAYAVDSPAPGYFTALPALRVEGGDCTSAPSTLALAYATATQFVAYADGQLAVEWLDIAQDTEGKDSFTRSGRQTIAQTGWVMPAARALPSGAVYVNRGLDLVRYGDRYLLASVAASASADSGALHVYELASGALVGTHDAPTAPVMPLNLQLTVVGNHPFVGGASYTDQRAAALMRVGCGP